MELMQKPVEYRGQQEAYVRNEHQARHERIAGGEDFAPEGINDDHRAHAAEDHAGVVECIYPFTLRQIMISEHSCNEGCPYDGCGNGEAPPQPPKEDAS